MPPILKKTGAGTKETYTDKQMLCLPVARGNCHDGKSAENKEPAGVNINIV